VADRPRERAGNVHQFRIGDEGFKGFLTLNHWDGELREVFLASAKQGSIVHGLLSSVALLISHGLQAGLPVYEIVDSLIDQVYEPKGMTNDPQVPTCTSLSDYVARRIALDFLTPAELDKLGVTQPRSVT
jgi:ribonucleoside-diphosphate reductase alpha chain